MSAGRRAPFIWTSRQQINPLGFTAHFKGAPRRDDGRNRWFLFRRVVELHRVPETALTRITADGRYQLFVNGARVARGPVRCAPTDQKYDEVEIAPHLYAGTNVIGAIVHVFGDDTSWYECVKGLWQPSFGDGAFWLDGPVAATGLDWRCIQCTAWDSETPEANHGLPAIESFDARAFPADWLAADFDDSGWDAVHILETSTGGAEGAFGGLVTRPFPQLSASGIPLLTEIFVPVPEGRWALRLHPDASLPIERRAYEEALSPLPESGAVRQAADGLHIGTGEDVALLFDFGRLLTGTVAFTVDAPAGTEIEIAVAEQIPGEWDEGGPAADARITRRPVLGLDAHITRYVARGGGEHFERFFWQAVKWLQISVRGADGPVHFSRLGVVHTSYPVETVGSFACDDPLFDQLWSVGAETLQLCMHDGWEDCPSREQRQWLGDATVEHLVGQAAFGPAINALNAKFLKDVAASQRPDGLTQMFAPGNHRTDGLLIPDWTLQWILNARQHLLWADDLATIEAIFPAIERALAWFLRLRGASGLIADLPYWHFMDWAGVGRAGEACTLNAQFAGCLTAAAEMADRLERPRVAVQYRGVVEEVQAALNARHWDGQRGVYVDCVGPASGMQDPRVSQHANAAMILWGGAPEARWPAMLDWICDPARLTFTAAPPVVPTGDPLNAEEGVVLANTFYSHFVYAALLRAGRARTALDLMRRFYGPMLAKGATTLWESFAPTASLCHGFSASPTYHLSHGIAGLQPAADGFSSLRFAPQPGDLERISAQLETLAGVIAVDLVADGADISATLTLPADMALAIVPPDGFALGKVDRQDGRVTIDLHRHS
jgi:alpha-L-rhamnosidase